MIKKLFIWFVVAKIFSFIYSFFKEIFFENKRNRWILIIWGITTTFLIYIVLWRMRFKYPIILAVLASTGLWDSIFQMVTNNNEQDV